MLLVYAHRFQLFEHIIGQIAVYDSACDLLHSVAPSEAVSWEYGFSRPAE